MRKAIERTTGKAWMAKSVACALCAALMIASAATASAVGGHTIAQVRESAPDYWDTGIVKNGEAVLAPVYVPDVEAVPVLRVRRAQFTDEQLIAVFGDAVDDNEPYGFWVRHYTEPALGSFGSGAAMYSQAVVIDIWQENWKPVLARVFPDRRIWEEGVKPSLENTYAEGQTVSLAEVIDAMSAKYEALYGEGGVFFTMATFYSGLHRDKGNWNYLEEFYPAGDYTGMGEYKVDGVQTLRGIPLFKPLRAAYQGLYGTQETNLTQSSLWPQTLYFIYMDEENYLASGGLIEEAESLAEDVPLCSAQEAIDALTPLIEQGKIINVYSLKLGYAVAADPDITYPTGKKDGWDEALWRAVPMWICECSYVKNPNREYPDGESEDPGASDPRGLDWHHSCLMVNAQTGEYIDTMRTDAKRVYAPALVTWDDIK